MLVFIQSENIMTKKELLEAIKDMPEDAEIFLVTGYSCLPIENCSVIPKEGKEVFALHPYPCVYSC